MYEHLRQLYLFCKVIYLIFVKWFFLCIYIWVIFEYYYNGDCFDLDSIVQWGVYIIFYALRKKSKNRHTWARTEWVKSGPRTEMFTYNLDTVVTGCKIHFLLYHAEVCWGHGRLLSIEPTSDADGWLGRLWPLRPWILS